MSQPDSSKVVLRYDDVYKSFGSKKVLCGVDLEVINGETFCIMGPSGSGKSVLLKHVIGLLQPDKGKVFVDGNDMSTITKKDLRALRARMGYVFQEAALLNWLSAGDNVALPLRETTKMSEKEIVERVQAKLALVKVPDVFDKLPGELSGGM
ncbi:MAG TPA: ATP-binding cassette domain-containing protein, partial [Polyangiales bacterium]|nr:ATP-binding cassette domain-containing protein [Polyangiales bacterium]